MKITVDWKEFETGSIPLHIRKQVIQTIEWMYEAGLRGGTEELLAIRMLNIYLEGTNEGIAIARKSFRNVLGEIGKSH